MEIVYSCACGARNSIEVPKRSASGKPPFFYCHDCGQPSWDHCTRCGFNIPVGAKSDYQFCKGCGARAEESFQSGVETLDFVGEVLTPAFLTPILMVGAYLVLHVYFHDEVNAFVQKVTPMMLAGHRYVFYALFWSLGWAFLYALVQHVTGPLWGLRRGKMPIPLVLREVALRGPVPIGQADLDAGIRWGRGLQLRLCRRLTLSRRRRIRSAYAKFLVWKAG